ncbi:putative Holliday junction resolvase [Pacificibacter maritimus]|uniref:Putative pre-16S rRNA nuclease n=1 Tax=Pacificibacter maritimus TaxID=762213 RepID=A0A3N4UVP7_9RHOB|nr:Holliday junction resolvase RuvX [Pacificibacter maritimus]RPE71569.1 putative Holliday junction resolvase [Pacificibacter maritimus]
MSAEIFDDITEFAAKLQPMRAIAGLDFGDKTIGVAVSDRFRNISSSAMTVRRKKFTLDAQELIKVFAEREIGGVVLGLPRNMDGSEGPRCQKTRAFARNLSQLIEQPITYWDERLSSVAADRVMLEADMSRAKRAEKIDQVAAGLILQGALDRLGHLKAQA